MTTIDAPTTWVFPVHLSTFRLLAGLMRRAER